MCKLQTIIALPASSEKHPAIFHHMSVIVKWWSSSSTAHTHQTILSSIMVSCSSHSSLWMCVHPSQNIDCHRWKFLSSLHSFFYKQCINDNEFQLQNYFLWLKNKQHFTPCNRTVKFLSNSSLYKPNTYRIHWIHSKLFVRISVTTYPAKMCKILPH